MDKKKKLLLVDDDDAVLEYLSVKLGREFELAACPSADEALARVRASRPDLVLCDIDLPGMDGGDLSAKDDQLAGRRAISKQAPVEQILARIREALY